MKKVTCLLAALLLMCGLSWAQQITWSAADQGYENGQVIESVDFNDYVAGEFFKGTNNNAPKYYTTGAAIRCYGGNYFTITSDYVLTEIVFGFATGEGSNAITSNVGTYEDGTWTGSANEVTFTISGTSGHRRFATFTITYDEGGNPAPVINANNVEIAYDATEGAIEYTITNGVDGGVLSAATEAEWINIGIVGETVPFTCEVNPDGERTATVTLTYTYDTDQTVTKNVTVTQANNPNAPGTEGNPYTVAQARAAIDAGTGTQGVYATGIVSAIPTAYNSTYANVTFNMVDEEGDEEFLQAYRCGGDEAANVTIGDVVVVYGNLTKYGSTYEFGQGCQIVTLTHPVITDPTITIATYTLNVDAEEHDGTIDVTYANVDIEMAEVVLCNAEGETTEYDWIQSYLNDEHQVWYLINANEGEARTAYLKVCILDESTLEPTFCSSILTVNQAAYVAPVLNYAELPFEFNGGRADIENTDGLTQEGLGTDYNANSNPTTKLKFDGTGDWMLLHFNEAPGTLTFDIKGNSFNGGTFTVQTSEDGETYEDLVAYTELGDVDTKTFDNLDENVRYIKWIYTEKSQGNVGLGNIYLYELGGGPAPVASITFSPNVFDLDAGQHVLQIPFTYENIEVTNYQSFTTHFYDAEGEEIQLIQGEAWYYCSVTRIINGEGYQLTGAVIANEGEARSGYMKVSALDAAGETVYSNLVTINQDAYVAPVASITIDPDFLTVDAGMHYGDDFLPLTYENIIVENAQSFGLQFYTAEGEETGMPTWFYAMVTPQTGNDAYQVTVATMPNDGEARSTYFKVYAYDADSTLVYSNLATVTQAAPVHDYAVLPFVWEGGSSADFAALNGVTLSGNGSDYNSNHAPYLIKFDSDNDYIMVKTDSQPGIVTIGVKMVGGGNTSTITVQGSADGETFTDIEVLTISGAQNDILTLETTNAFGADDRYVKLLFTKGSNVGVGPITITKGTAPSITLTPDTFNLDAVGPLNGMSLPTATVTYHNFEITQASDFHVQFYNAEGEEQEMPTWLLHTEVSGPITDSSSYQSIYQSISIVTANEGPARSAYYKVYAFDADSIPVYSNLVTYNQAGVLQQYTLTVEPFENLELITFVNDEMVMEADGEIQVNEGDHIMLSIVADEGYDMETLMVNGVNHVNDIADDFTYEFDMPAEAVTISATAIEHVVPTPGEWVMTSLNDLTENDVFVIVGVYDVDESSFAMPNNSTGAPSAVEVTMVGNTLSGDIDDNLKWNLSIGEDGYTFYPDGETETWLYCTNTNNGVRVGTNENNVFSMTSEGYLFNNATERYIGIYNSQDWRCYTSINNNIKEQTFAFYKRVDESEIETYTLEIEGYGEITNPGGYYLIASPVSMIRPTADNGFLTEVPEQYDLYRFDQNCSGEEWRNYKLKHFNIASGKGYLYASQENTTLTFTGIPYEGNGEIALDYTEGANLAGWNLIGNPYNQEATLYVRYGNEYNYVPVDYYVMNEDGSEFELAGRDIHPMEGVFVKATAADEIACFSDGWVPGAWGGDPWEEKLNLSVSDNNGKGDYARIRFGEGNGLEKFMLNPANTKLYFPMDDANYAVVYADNMGEMPLSFSAAADGTYTLSINAENIEMEYLHLIDNMTGAEIDLLETPDYTFTANVNDNANRFTLVFAGLTGMDENNANNFAFFSNGSFIVSNQGNAMLQVIDLTGRIVKSETINGTASVHVNATPGVYMLRLVNGDNVKVQKVVVR